MVLDTSGFTGGGPLASLIFDIVEECTQKDFIGIVLDAGINPGSPAQLALASALSKATARHELEYFVPEALSDSGENAIVRISTALSGGTLCRHITDAVAKYGAERVTLELERVRMDFTLPSLGGVGKELSNDEMLELKAMHKATSFFSPELMVNYFTYRDKNGPHFVLHDNAKSLRRKLAAGARAGIKYTFLFYPQVSDIYDDILSNGGI